MRGRKHDPEKQKEEGLVAAVSTLLNNSVVTNLWSRRPENKVSQRIVNVERDPNWPSHLLSMIPARHLEGISLS